MCVVVWSLLITSKLVDHYTDFTLLSSAFESNYMLKLHSYEITILGITQQIGTKFLHRETLDHVAWSPANLWRPPPNAAEKNSILRGFSLTLDSKTMHRFTHFPADDFREISTQNVNRCHEFLRNRILKFFKKGSFTSENPHSYEKNLAYTYVARLQPWLLGLERIPYVHTNCKVSDNWELLSLIMRIS